MSPEAPKIVRMQRSLVYRIAHFRAPLGEPMRPETKTFLSLLGIHFFLDAFGGIWPIYKHLTAIPLGAAGLIATIATFSTLITQPLFGIWADRGYLRAAVLWGTLLTFPMMLLGPMRPWIESLSLTAAIPVLFGILFLAKLGQAMYHPAGATIAGMSFASGRSTLISVFVAAGTIGYGISQSVFTGVYFASGGHTEWLLIPGGLALILAILWCRPRETPHAERTGFVESFKRIPFRQGQLQCLFWMLALISAVNQGLFFLLPEFVSQRGYPYWMVNGGVMAGMVFGGALAMVPGGYLADRFGRRKILIGSIGLSGITHFLFILAPPMPALPFLALAFAAGGISHIANPVGVALGQQLYPRINSLISGVLMGLAWAVGSLAPSFVGGIAALPAVGPAQVLTFLGALYIFPFACALYLDTEIHPAAPLHEAAIGG
jgi:MFS transporter, FSR family, fosmidomycin resistance protein